MKWLLVLVVLLSGCGAPGETLFQSAAPAAAGATSRNWSGYAASGCCSRP
jgi:hypothetical protein